MRFEVYYNGKVWEIVDQVSATVVDSATTEDQAKEKAEKLNEEKGW